MRLNAVLAAALLAFAASSGRLSAQDLGSGLGGDLPFKQNAAFQALQTAAQARSIKLSDRYPSKCDRASDAPEALYFCEYALYGTRVRFWSVKPDGNVGLISARPLGTPSLVYWTTAISLVIATIDASLSDDEIQGIAEGLTTAARNLSGQKTAMGKTGFYMSRVGQQGLTFMATSMPAR